MLPLIIKVILIFSFPTYVMKSNQNVVYCQLKRGSQGLIETKLHQIGSFLVIFATCKRLFTSTVFIRRILHFREQ